MKQNMVMGIVRAALAAIGGMLCMSGYSDSESWSQVSGALIVLVMAAWSAWSKHKIILPPAGRASLLLVFLCSASLLAGCAVFSESSRNANSERFPYQGALTETNGLPINPPRWQ